MAQSKIQSIRYTDQMLFNIQLTSNHTLQDVPKSAIIKSVHDAFYLGMANMFDLMDNVVDTRKIEIFCKLYHMTINEKLKAWLDKYNRFMSQPLRAESERAQLVMEYNEILIGADMSQIDKATYKLADVYATKLLQLHLIN